MKHLFSILFITAGIFYADAKTYELTQPESFEPIRSEHLKMGGTSPNGGSIEINNLFLSRDGKPMIPVCGEFHYSRYPEEQWEQEIIKMKNGGINVLPTYVFWSLHEPKENEWVWSGNRNLRKFFELCGKHGMDVIVRIGPFGHGEIRNGGIPDWIFTKNLDIRSNDPKYLHYVNLLYKEIGKQLEGLYYKDGGPIIGCQIENEHQHSAAPWAIEYDGEPVRDFTVSSYDKGITKLGVSVQDEPISKAEKGNEHMRTLLQMAKDAGIITPFYTATGWGNAAVIEGESIPVTAAYTYPTWVANQRKSNFCLFKDLRKNPDYSPVRYNPQDYPSAAAEMGVGIQMVYSKRPICAPETAEALMIRVLGSGSNIIGYYMFHGGSTPLMEGGNQFFSDQPMGLPKISYDFQAPLGEFGLESPSFRPLRVIHSFLDDFGGDLAPMQTVLPENVESLVPDDRGELRYAARMNTQGNGFLFLINSQDHDNGREDLEDLQVKLNLKDEVISIPESGGFTLPAYTSAIFPFNLDMNGVMLKYATAQPLMRMYDKGVPHYFFTYHEGINPEFFFDKKTIKGSKVKFVPKTDAIDTFEVTSVKGNKVKVTTLPYSLALNASKVNGKLLVTDATVLDDGNDVKLLSLGNPEFEYIIYPSPNGFKPYKKELNAVTPVLNTNESVPLRMEVFFTESAYDNPDVNEYFLKVPYTGDLAMAFLDNEMILDHFWQGKPWIIGLERFEPKMSEGMPLGFYFRPLRSNAPFLNDLPEEVVPDFKDGPVLKIESPEIIPEYILHLPSSSI